MNWRSRFARALRDSCTHVGATPNRSSTSRRGFERAVLVGALLVMVFGTGCDWSEKVDDQALAERAVIRKSDLEGEWTGQTSDEGTALDRCVKLDVPGLVVTGRAHSTFNLYAVGSVLSFAAVYQDSADEAFERVVEHARNCGTKDVREFTGGMAKLVEGLSLADLSPAERALFRAFSLTDVNVREISLPPIGDKRRAWGVTIGRDIGVFGLDLDAGITPLHFAVIHKGRSVTLLSFSSIGGLDDDFLVELSEAVASRM